MIVGCINGFRIVLFLCLQYPEALRPPMGSVVAMLQGDSHTDIVDIEAAEVPLGFDDSRSIEIQQFGLQTSLEEYTLVWRAVWHHSIWSISTTTFKTPWINAFEWFELAEDAFSEEKLISATGTQWCYFLST